jgi:uroporphyrinogen decarboxylase
MFGRPFMGGMDRHGVLVTGTKERIHAEVSAVLRDAPDLFVLGADCTVPSDIPWENLRTAIEAAHAGR